MPFKKGYCINPERSPQCGQAKAVNMESCRTNQSQDELVAARWPLARIPHLLETSLPGVFAVGDVRSGNLKRVASAVGEGAIAVALVHQVLHE